MTITNQTNKYITATSFLAALVTPIITMGGMYKCVQPSGNVIYQQKQCSGTEQQKSLRFPKEQISIKNPLNPLLRKMCVDYLNLPNIQWDNKYKGLELKGRGVIHALSYDKDNNVSHLTIRFSEMSSDVEGGLSKPFNVDCSFDRCIFRYLVELNIRGAETALTYKKGDDYEFDATVQNIDHDYWITENRKFWMRDYKIKTR